jgi:hypothetical protein
MVANSRVSRVTSTLTITSYARLRLTTSKLTVDRPTLWVSFSSSILKALTRSPLPSSTMNIISPASSHPRLLTLTGPLTQIVRVNIGETISFSPQLFNVSVGDTVWFYTIDALFGFFAIYNTTLDRPCIPVARFGDDRHRYVLIQVNNTKPVWFVGSRNQELFRCYPPAHFALNPGT